MFVCFHPREFRCQLWQDRGRGQCWSSLEDRRSQQGSRAHRWSGWWLRWQWGTPATQGKTCQSELQLQWTRYKQLRTKEPLLTLSERKIMRWENGFTKTYPSWRYIGKSMYGRGFKELPQDIHSNSMWWTKAAIKVFSDYPNSHPRLIQFLIENKKLLVNSPAVFLYVNTCQF